ncbi:hypothetical protein [Fictibacillus enclensis]|uniref:hypothetical protein n=1 Tax=Fictibacillus enclensis TaxID=1017270 RepID=UPI0024BF7C22|nr:hypothetical protein [Fictibacillus enclensis]WHY71218.1 hypothetical protein QNH15_19705 [Fictibacillus enclensis]
MFSLRGDAHKVYSQLKKASDNGQTLNGLKEIIEVEEICNFYHSINSDTLKKIYYRMIKEKNGSGTIPIFVSSAPWLFFLFSKQLHQFLFKEGNFLWIVFIFLYVFILTISVILHFHEKSWAAVHIEIILDILKERNNSPLDAMRD